MCSALDVAKYITGAISVDALKLQKLLYYAQAVHMVLNNHELLFQEPIEAWQYGPVVREVYQKYKKFGLDDIKPDYDTEIELKDNQRRSIDMTLEYYGTMSGVGLMKKTHNESPWKNNYEYRKNNVIPNDEIYNYFVDKFDFEDEN